MYVAYGNSTISVAQLSADGLSQVRTQQVFTTPSSVGTLEGARFYKRNGSYYIFAHPAGQRPVHPEVAAARSARTRCVRSCSTCPARSPAAACRTRADWCRPQNGDWYYMSFVDAYPGGRVPALAPITWTADGWPQMQTVNGGWGASLPEAEHRRRPKPVKPMIGTDTFTGSTLGPQWEWNHNPDNTKWSVDNGLRLQTATVTNDLYSARNTLTHRIQGPTSTATIELDYSALRDGDRTGLAMLRNSSAWIGVRRDNGATRVVDDQRPDHGQQLGHHQHRHGDRRARAVSGGSDLAAGHRRHPARLRPAGPVLLQHRRHQLHRPG